MGIKRGLGATMAIYIHMQHTLVENVSNAYNASTVQHARVMYARCIHPSYSVSV